MTGEQANELERLKSEVRAAKINYDRARSQYEAALAATHPLKPGDVIRSTKGNLARVDRIIIKFASPRVIAFMQKKDGTFGQREAPMWRDEWEKAERVDLS